MAAPKPRTNARRTAPLSRDEIVAAAARRAAEHGIEDVTIRGIANDLSVAPMTLYSHVKNKDEILDAIASMAMGSVLLSPERGIDVRSAITEVAQAFLQLMREHPVAIRLISSRITTNQESHRGATETVLGHLRAAGIPDDLVIRLYGFLIMYAMGFASYQGPRQYGRDSSPASIEHARQLTHIYAGFPANDFPHTVAMAERLVAIPEDATYWFAVNSTIAWVEKEMAVRRSSADASAGID